MILGFCYGPFRDGEDPNRLMQPPVENLEEDADFYMQTGKMARFYDCRGTLGELPRIFSERNIDYVASTWIEDDIKDCNSAGLAALEMKVIDQNDTHCKGIIVGNETLHFNRQPPSVLYGMIDNINAETNILITTAETFDVWMSYPELVNHVDFIMLNDHPYYGGVNVNDSAQVVVNDVLTLREMYPGKRIVVGETGWPSGGSAIGSAVPSEENQAKFINDFVLKADQNNIEYFLFELFDEKWKEKFGNAEHKFGVAYSNGTIKPLIDFLFPGIVPINRPGRDFATPIAVPFNVYKDGCSSDNHFFPSGKFGDYGTLEFDENWKTNPFEGDSCIRLVYSPPYTGIGEWSGTGIFWQFPLNNWGNDPGYKIPGGATKLSFYIKSDTPNTKAEFKIGANHTPGAQWNDSFPSRTTGFISIPTTWTKKEISLQGAVIDNIDEGLVIYLSNVIDPPAGGQRVIYLDNIKIE
ncbi:hypothetical protein COU57_03010 [Candidatus Pacearchaeota archaeon CG10_big_fil_rev_8_21_14_0_10_32_14]|nr:MAG: hypothetical protein COU57_03010 [Candidatus Pacearchaeota archaeon CG10_big_fil_rev_8_21_14_0_10_32_14]